jgi:hydrogenase nickel incorporation protein HypA/HybF
MHEMSLCEGVLQILEQQAQEQQFSRVKIVWLEVGALAAVEITALRFCFDCVVTGSLAENAQLLIEEIPGLARCAACGTETAVQQLYDVCPQCGSFQLQIIDGDQMRIKELEVE